MKRTLLGSALGLLFLLLPAHVMAQQGLFVGAALNGTAYSPEEISEIDEDSDSETGYGLSGLVGYGFGVIAPYAKLSWASMNTDDDEDDSNNPSLVHLDVGARLSLPLGGFIPYINAAYTFQRFSQDYQSETLKANGNGITGGVGLQLLFGSLALEAAINVTSGEFTELEYGDQTQDLNDANNTTTRVDLGVTFHTGGSGQN